MSERVEKPHHLRSRQRGRPAGARTKGLLQRRVRDTGAHSRLYRLGRVDRRTQQGRFMDKITAALLEHVGPNPSVVQRMLISRAALLSLRLAQIDEKVLSDQEFTQIDNHCTIAWQNALVRCLTAIGVHPEAARGGLASVEAVLAEMGDDASAA